MIISSSILSSEIQVAQLLTRCREVLYHPQVHSASLQKRSRANPRCRVCLKNRKRTLACHQNPDLGHSSSPLIRAGQESFKAITRSYYKGSIAAFLVFDITCRSSFDNLHKWLYEIKNHSHDRIEITLLGNKIDLKSK
jgi:hypothetical protein